MAKHDRKTDGPPDYGIVGCRPNCRACEIAQAVKEEREHCLRLIEAPISGLLDQAQRIDQSGGDSRLWRHSVEVLQDAARSVRESGTFRDAMEARKS